MGINLNCYGLAQLRWTSPREILQKVKILKQKNYRQRGLLFFLLPSKPGQDYGAICAANFTLICCSVLQEYNLGCNYELWKPLQFYLLGIVAQCNLQPHEPIHPLASLVLLLLFLHSIAQHLL